jgi:hypothetical protein
MKNFYKHSNRGRDSADIYNNANAENLGEQLENFVYSSLKNSEINSAEGSKVFFTELTDFVHDRILKEKKYDSLAVFYYLKNIVSAALKRPLSFEEVMEFEDYFGKKFDYIINEGCKKCGDVVLREDRFCIKCGDQNQNFNPVAFKKNYGDTIERKVEDGCDSLHREGSKQNYCEMCGKKLV